MDDFQKQLLICLALAITGSTISHRILKKRYLKQGRSIKNLEFVIFAMGAPIVTIPVLLTPVIPFWGKVWAVVLGCSVGFLKIVSLISARRNFRKVLGSPEDPDTGRPIEEEDKKNYE